MNDVKSFHSLRTALCPALALFATTACLAQGYPAKTIRMVVPIAAGGATDTAARLISQKLSEQMAVPIVVDNRAGAGTVLGTELVAKAPADGYTLMSVAPEFSINPSLRKLPYDPLKDFVFITQIASGQYFLSTHPSLPVKSTREFIALAKTRPGQVTFASSGNGSANHLAGVMFQHMTGTKLIHVPYKGAGPAVTALLSGETDFMFSNVASAITYVKSGKLRAIASTGAKRSLVAPEVPTITESAVPGFIVTGFVILMAPAGTPAAIIATLNAEAVKALQSAVLKERLAALGLEPVGSSPQECSAFIAAEIAKWAPVVKAAGMKVD